MLRSLIAGGFGFLGSWRGGFGGKDIYPAAAFVESDFSIRQGEQCPIATGADVEAGKKLGAALADQNASRSDDFAAKSFYPEPFAGGIASVANAALTFLVCHKVLKFDFVNLDSSQLLPMADGLVIAFAAFHLE